VIVTDVADKRDGVRQVTTAEETTDKNGLNRRLVCPNTGDTKWI
jgi:hypothetical protein